MKRAWKRRVWIDVLRRFGHLVDVKVGDWRMRADVRDEVIGSFLYLYGDYEAGLRRWLTLLNLGGGVCVDVGANIGLHTLAMSQLAGKDGRVFAFEPEAHNLALLRHNLRVNSSVNVTVSAKAVGDQTGTARLAVHPANHGDHRVVLSTMEIGLVVNVPITTLDEELSEDNDGKIKLVKMDVQGYELHVLRGMKRLIDRNPQLVLSVEVFPDALQSAGSTAQELVAFLSILGFTGWEFSDDRLQPLGPPWAYDFIRNGKDVNVILCRDKQFLRRVAGEWFGKTLPANEQR